MKLMFRGYKYDNGLSGVRPFPGPPYECAACHTILPRYMPCTCGCEKIIAEPVFETPASIKEPEPKPAPALPDQVNEEFECCECENLFPMSERMTFYKKAYCPDCYPGKPKAVKISGVDRMSMKDHEG